MFSGCLPFPHHSLFFTGPSFSTSFSPSVFQYFLFGGEMFKPFFYFLLCTFYSFFLWLSQEHAHIVWLIWIYSNIASMIHKALTLQSSVSAPSSCWCHKVTITFIKKIPQIQKKIKPNRSLNSTRSHLSWAHHPKGTRYNRHSWYLFPPDLWPEAAIGNQNKILDFWIKSSLPNLSPVNRVYCTSRTQG